MNIKKALKNFVFFGSVIYTAISTGMILLGTAMTDGQYTMMLEADRFLCILLFSFMLSLGSTLLRVDAIPRVTAACLHAACYVLGFFIFMLLCEIKFAPAVIATAVFAVIYAICTVICRAVARSFKKAQNAPKTDAKQVKNSKNKKEYQSQFTKNT
jgi:hypothetical protein